MSESKKIITRRVNGKNVVAGGVWKWGPKFSNLNKISKN